MVGAGTVAGFSSVGIQLLSCLWCCNLRWKYTIYSFADTLSALQMCGGSLRTWEWNTTGKLTMSLPFTIVCRCMSVVNGDSWDSCIVDKWCFVSSMFAKGVSMHCYIWSDWMRFCRYVDSLLGAYKQYSTKLGYGGLDKEVRYGASNLWCLLSLDSCNAGLAKYLGQSVP